MVVTLTAIRLNWLTPFRINEVARAGKPNILLKAFPLKSNLPIYFVIFFLFSDTTVKSNVTENLKDKEFYPVISNKNVNEPLRYDFQENRAVLDFWEI